MESYSFNITDGIALAIVMASALFALVRGLVAEVLGIFSWLLALFVTLYVQEFTFPFFAQIISSEIVARIVSFSSVFIIMLVIGHVITYRISDAVDDGPLGSLDNTLGFIFGLLRGVIIISLFYMLVANFTLDKGGKKGEGELPQWLATAKSLHVMKGGAGLIAALLPHDMQTVTEDALDLEADKETRTKQLRFKEAVKEKKTGDKKLPAKIVPVKDDGYGNKERQSLDHLIESVQ